MNNRCRTYESVKDEVNKYTVFADLKSDNPQLIQWVRYHGYEELLSSLSRKRTNWTVDMAHSEALKYEYLRDFDEFSQACCVWARNNNCFELITSHFKPYEKPGTFKGTSNMAGIYFLYDGPEIVYIGKSESTLYHRLTTHRKDTTKVFNKAVVYLISNPADVSIAEMYLINKYNPRYNKESNSGVSTRLNITNLNSIIDTELVFSRDGIILDSDIGIEKAGI